MKLRLVPQHLSGSYREALATQIPCGKWGGKQNSEVNNLMASCNREIMQHPMKENITEWIQLYFEGKGININITET